MFRHPASRPDRNAASGSVASGVAHVGAIEPKPPIEKLTARVIRENLVRFDRLPIVQRIHDMPSQAAGAQVVLAVAEVDLFEPALHVRYVESVASATDTTA